jgi:hypothetical protein
MLLLAKIKEMTTINKINRLKIPIFKVNPELNSLLEIPMFEDKVAELNEILRTVGLPDQLMFPTAKKKRKPNKKVTTKKKTTTKLTHS